MDAVRRDLLPTLRLAWPVIVAELGWMFMGVVDTVMVGRIAPEAIGAVGLGSILYFSAAIFGMGLLLGLDTFVSQAYGAGNLRECHRWLRDGVHLAVLATLPLMGITFTMVAAMPLIGLHPDVQALTVPYVTVVAWGSLPLLLYAAFRRYLQALGIVRPVMITLLAANLINGGANWVLIYGHLGMPAMGVTGAAWATNIGRVFMAVSLLLVILRHEHAHKVGLFDVPFLQVEWDRLARLFRLGAPAATQLTAEVGVFGAVAALAGRIDPIALAAHQVALNLASVTFMVPLGLASAGAVRVGHAIGRRSVEEAASAGGAVIALALGFMSASALLFILGAGPLVRLFTSDPAVVSTGVILVRVAAAFQLSDGLQVVTTGALRGLGDTRTPMFTNLVGHWLIALPIAAIGGFTLGYGVVGLWVGLCVGLTLVGLFLLGVWRRHISDLRREPEAMARLAPGGAPQ
ncbi:MAG: MATE family efflux transporter [Vicinamibacteria bacterium]|nr:MATE family efflux transporter [Vicinamibacteria bacterium]